MSTIQEMLSMNGGSFARAEQMALQFISNGRHDVYLDLALLLHVQGKITSARQAGLEYEKLFPDCPRGKLVESWFKFYDGDLRGGFEHFDHSRKVGTLINNFEFNKPMWAGEDIKNQIIMVISEGGIGDEILGLRSASFLSGMGAKVVVACSESVMPLFSRTIGVHTVVQRHSKNIRETPVECQPCTYYDKYIPAFSSFKYCNLKWDNLYPGKYVNPQESLLWERIIPKTNKLNIGLRWRGNPTYEHEQFRRFPVRLLWDAIKDIDANFYSLQKDDHTEMLPEKILDLDPLLGNWEQTASAISRLDLVITSCTSIAHLSGAIGIPTWVIVPVMSYWPWAKQGNTSPWYPSVTLFRQVEFGNWDKPFEQIRIELKIK